MLIKFLHHASFYMENQGYGLMTDPWFTSSTIEKPVLQSLLPSQKTIDFQVPDHQYDMSKFLPKVFLISHLHTHHAHLEDIKYFLKRSLGVIDICIPKISKGMYQSILQGLGDLREKARITMCGHLDSHSFGPYTVTSFEQIHGHHNIWYVSSPSGSFMHLADLGTNKNWWDRRLDPLYNCLIDLRPDLMGITAGGHHTILKTRMLEASGTAPLEAARLTAMINPKMAAVMGVFNQSIWRGRNEISLANNQAEEDFEWGVRHHAPHVRVEKLTPGKTYLTHLTNAARFTGAVVI